MTIDGGAAVDEDVPEIDVLEAAVVVDVESETVKATRKINPKKIQAMKIKISNFQMF